MAYFHERADDVAHHVAEKCGRFDGINEQLPAFFQGSLVHLPDCMRRFATGGPKRRKIMFAEHAGNCGEHGLTIEIFVQMPGAVQIKRRRRGAIEDMIFVNTTPAVPARIERIGNELNLFDGDVRRREGIETAQNSESLKFFIDEKISHLADSMNPGIGATGTYDSRWRPKKSHNRTFENFLDGFTVRLNLPTAVTRAVILN